MARTPQPLEIAQIKGSTRRNPQRYRDKVPKSDKELGDAPDFLSKDEKAIWNRIRENSVKGVLTINDELALETLCILQVEFRRQKGKFSAAKMTLLENLKTRFGLNPSARVQMGKKEPEKEANEFDQF